MSATMTLKRTMVRGTNAAMSLLQFGLLFCGLVMAMGFARVFAMEAEPDYQVPLNVAAALPASIEVTAPVVSMPAPPTTVLSPKMQSALDYVKRRYRVSSEALLPVFEIAQSIGLERRIDPLLIVAIIGVESRFNPFAESPLGAQGLMQVIPRFHQDKLPSDADDDSLLDPETNIRVGVNVLEEAIRRRGGLIAGLQSYAGSSSPNGEYAAKVLAEKTRLEQASNRKLASAN